MAQEEIIAREEAFKSASWEAREAMVRTAWKDMQETMAFLKQALADQDMSVRATAITALGSLRAEGISVQDLLAFAQEDTIITRDSAITALERLGEAAAQSLRAQFREELSTFEKEHPKL